MAFSADPRQPPPGPGSEQSDEESGMNNNNLNDLSFCTVRHKIKHLLRSSQNPVGLWFHGEMSLLCTVSLNYCRSTENDFSPLNQTGSGSYRTDGGPACPFIFLTVYGSKMMHLMAKTSLCRFQPAATWTIPVNEHIQTSSRKNAV